MERKASVGGYGCTSSPNTFPGFHLRHGKKHPSRLSATLLVYPYVSDLVFSPSLSPRYFLQCPSQSPVPIVLSGTTSTSDSGVAALPLDSPLTLPEDRCLLYYCLYALCSLFFLRLSPGSDRLMGTPLRLLLSYPRAAIVKYYHHLLLPRLPRALVHRQPSQTRASLIRIKRERELAMLRYVEWSLTKEKKTIKDNSLANLLMCPFSQVS